MPSSYEHTCGWVLDHIEPYIDDDVSPAERERLEAHVARCASCAAELVLARRVVGELRALPVHEAPEWVTAAARARVLAADPAGGDGGRFAALLESLLGARLRAAATAVVLAATAIALWWALAPGPHVTRSPQPQYTQKQIETAAQEAQLALAYVDKYSRMTTRIIRQDVIEDGVVEPIQRALQEKRPPAETNRPHKRSDT